MQYKSEGDWCIEMGMNDLMVPEILEGIRRYHPDRFLENDKFYWDDV